MSAPKTKYNIELIRSLVLFNLIHPSNIFHNQSKNQYNTIKFAKLNFVINDVKLVCGYYCSRKGYIDYLKNNKVDAFRTAKR